MFSLRSFVKSGYLKSVGNMPDYWIILNAAGYMDKGVLTENDLADIQAAIDRKNQRNVENAPTAETPDNEEDTPSVETAEEDTPAVETPEDAETAEAA